METHVGNIKKEATTNNSNTAESQGDPIVDAVDLSDSFHTASNTTEFTFWKETEMDTIAASGNPDTHSDVERYLTSQEQNDDSETSCSAQKITYPFQTRAKVNAEQTQNPRRETDNRSPLLKSRDNSIESIKARPSSIARNSVEHGQNVHRTHRAMSDYENPTYVYSERDDGWVTSIGHAYNIHSNDHPDHNPVTIGSDKLTSKRHDSIPTVNDVFSTPHNIRTGTTPMSHSSRSPTSLRSPNSSKSTTPRHIDTGGTVRGHDHLDRSSLPVGFSKTSTPCKSQASVTTQAQCSKSTLHDCATASSSKANTPLKLPSHNTSMQSESVVCRICHDGDSSEVLISPCYCAGSMGLLHVSCLQRWLGSSNKTSCEICNFEFALQKRRMPISMFLREPGTPKDKRNLICDIICFMMITPLTVIVIWLCIHGTVKYYADSDVEKGGLIGLSVSLLLLYGVWLTVAIRQNLRLWNDWKMFHQEVTLLCKPSLKKRSPHTNSVCAGSRSTLGSVHIQSIKVNVQGPMNRSNVRQSKQKGRKDDSKKQERIDDQTIRFTDLTTHYEEEQSEKVAKAKAKPVTSADSYVNTKYNDQGNFRRQQDVMENVHFHVKKNKSVRKYDANEERQYANRGEMNEANSQIFKDDKYHHSPRYKYGQHDGRSNRSCEESSDLSSYVNEENRRGGRFRSKPTVSEKSHVSNDHTYINQITSNVNGTDTSGHRRNDITPQNQYINYDTRGSTKVDENQCKTRQNIKIPSGSYEDFKSRDNTQDFVTKWVDDQTKVLAGQTHKLPSQGFTELHGATTKLGKSSEQYPLYQRRDIGQSIENRQSTEKMLMQTHIRKPPTLSLTSSEVSFEQVLRDNNLAPSPHLSDRDEEFVIPTV